MERTQNPGQRPGLFDVAPGESFHYLTTTSHHKGSPMRRCLFAFLLVAFATFARADEPKVLTKIAFGSCADQDKPLPIFDTMAAAKPDLLVLMGDNIYADLDRKVKVNPDVIR